MRRALAMTTMARGQLFVGLLCALSVLGGSRVASAEAGEPPRCLADTALHVAVATGDRREVARLLGASPELRAESNALDEVPLHIAARAGDVAMMRILLRDVGGELEAQDAGGMSPLLRALASGREAAARLLLAAGASVESTSDQGIGALHLAARRGLVRLVPTLLRAHEEGVARDARAAVVRAALARRDALGLAPVDHAALSGSEATVHALVSRGAVVDPMTLVLACGLSRTPLAARLARSVPAPEAGATVLDAALRLAAGLREGPGEPASTPVHLDAATLACLFDVGARPSTAVFRAVIEARRANLGVLIALRSGGARGETPGAPMLHVAAAAGETALVQLLLGLGARLDALDSEGATALHRAILSNSESGVRALLAAGDPAQSAFQGVHPVGLALRGGALRALGALTERLGYEARSAAALDRVVELEDIVARDPEAVVRVGDDGLTPLQHAARFGALQAAKVLVLAGAPLQTPVAAGVRIGERDVSGWTALDFAASGGHPLLFQWLVTRGALDGLASNGRPPRTGGVSARTDAAERQARFLDGKRWDAWGFGAANVNATAPPPNPEEAIVVTAAGGPAGRGLGSSFIALGGGLLRDERALEHEAIPLRHLSMPGVVHDLDPELPEVFGQCLASSHWFEAERLARAMLDDLRLPPLPEAVQGRGWSGQRLLEASALQTLGRVLIERKRFGEASEAFAAATSALSPWEGGASGLVQVLPVHRVWAAIQEGRARLNMRNGSLQQAELDLRRGIELLHGSALAALRAGLQGKLAIVLGEAAHYSDAIEAARAALRSLLGNPSSDGPSPFILRMNLATLLARAGERSEARALVLAELARVERFEVWDAEDVAMIRYAAGMWRILDGAGEAGEALMTAAREGLADVHPMHAALGRFDLGLGLVLIGQARYEEATTALTRGAWSLMRSEDVTELEALSSGAAVDYARILNARAAIERHLDRPDGALQIALTAYAVVVGAQALEARWTIELELARIQAARGHLAASIFFGKRAVATLDQIRAAGLPPALAQAFIDDRLAAWRELADHLVQAGRFIEATAALAGIKADEGEGLALRGSGVGEPSDAPQALPAPMPDVGVEGQGDRPERPLKAAQREVNRLAEGKRVGGPGRVDQAALELARKTLRERRRAFEAWLQALEGELEAMPVARAQAIAAMNLRDLAGMQSTLDQLGDGVVMVHYLITQDHLRSIITTADSQVGREAAISPRDLSALVFQFRQVLVDPSRDAKAAARALYEVLIAPIAADLEAAKAQTLLISLDGALRYAPLAALWDGRQWLVERFRVVHFARAALPTIMAGRPAEESLAAFGCGRAVPGYQELAAVPAELEGIVKRDEADPDGEIPGVVRLDDAFSREALTSLLELKKYSAVHIASHFVLGPGGESESYLLLGDGQRLTLEDIRFDLRFDGVDLLSLSACNTAVGDRLANDGREIEGFASLALRLGARAVLATLWPVSDASTGLFMRTLYRLIKAEPTRSRAEVLRLAMLSFIRGEVALPGPEGAPADGRGPRPLALVGTTTVPVSGASAAPTAAARGAIDLAHPRYWAPFVLIGNWR